MRATASLAANHYVILGAERAAAFIALVGQVPVEEGVVMPHAEAVWRIECD